MPSVLYVHGLFTLGDTGFRRTHYTAVVEPTLKRFDLRSNWRIFQRQPLPDIITNEFSEQKLTDIHTQICFELPRMLRASARMQILAVRWLGTQRST